MTQPTAEAYEAALVAWYGQTPGLMSDDKDLRIYAAIDAIWPFAIAEGRRQLAGEIEQRMHQALRAEYDAGVTYGRQREAERLADATVLVQCEHPEIESLLRRLATAEAELVSYQDWSNSLAEHIPDDYDCDEAQEAIISRWLNDVLADRERLAPLVEAAKAWRAGFAHDVRHHKGLLLTSESDDLIAAVDGSHPRGHRQ